jgi:hypothetical protein
MTMLSMTESNAICPLPGKIVYLIGESLRNHLSRLLGVYLEASHVERVVLLTATPAAAAQIAAPYAAHREEGRLATVLTGDDLESALAAARRGWGEPDVVIHTPVTDLPAR